MKPGGIIVRADQQGIGHQPGRRRALVTGIVVFSVLVHVAALVAFGIWVVSRYFKEPEAVFEMKPDLRIAPQTPEHRLNMARHEAMAPKPVMTKRLVSTRPSAIALPELPVVEVDQAVNLDKLMATGITSAGLAGAIGLGTAEGLSGGGGTGSGMSFFGIHDKGQSVVIMIDVSDSMFGRTGDMDYETRKLVRHGKEQGFQRVRDEAIALIDGLGVNARFGIIRWSGSARVWKPELIPATDDNKRLAKEHIQNEVDAFTARPTGGRPGGTRHDYALEELFKLDPEIAFMISDGNATRSGGAGGRLEVIPTDDLEKMIDAARATNKRVPKIHTIYYLTGSDNRDEERMLKQLSRRTDGESRKVKAETR